MLATRMKVTSISSVCATSYLQIIGHKASVHTHRNYLIIVSPPFVPSATAASATVRNFANSNGSTDSADVTKVVVFDLENKLVAYTGMSDSIRDVFSAGGQIYILSNDGKVRTIYTLGLYFLR